ncbi:MAG: gliding motility protein GldM [Bacteroidia bacterium]|nr:gliding motility protein GldM [Bacteroidia bacterium]
MSNAKETPRQKMISLMYLVLICLLALNVSREVLLGFVHINEGLETTNKNFTNNTKNIMEAFKEAIHQGRHEFEPYYRQASRANRLTDDLYVYIDSLKKELIRYTEGKEGADTISLEKAEQLDNTDKPSYFLIGPDETKPESGKYKALELKQNIMALADSLQNMIDYMKDRDGLRLPEEDYLLLKNKITAFRPRTDYFDPEGLKINWEIKNFYNQPLAAVITNLSKLQGDVRNIEGQLINTFASASGKLSVKFDRMQARIVPVSQYVQSGSAYTADVFLSASSSDFKEDNLQFIMGDVDTTTGTIDKGAITLPVENGTGKIQLATSRVGHQFVKGWIKFRDGTGKYKYFSYNNEYVVANPVVAVSPDKMNVFYAGVDNPVSVSAAGVAATDLRVTIAGCGGEVIDRSNGKYDVKVKGEGTCSVTVMKKTAAGYEKQDAPHVFRVKKIPSPPLRINGKPVIGNVDMKVVDARNIVVLGVDNTGFEFNAPFKVLEFKVSMAGPGTTYQEFPCTGNQLSTKAKQCLSRLKAGSKIYFEDVKVNAPDGIREFPMAKVTVK